MMDKISKLIDKILPDENFYTQPDKKRMKAGSLNLKEILSFLNQIKNGPSYRMRNVHVYRENEQELMNPSLKGIQNG